MAKHDHETMGVTQSTSVPATDWMVALSEHEVELPNGDLTLLSEISSANVLAIFTRGLDTLVNSASNNGVNIRVNKVLNPDKPSKVALLDRNTWKETHVDQVESWIDDELAALTESIMNGTIESSSGPRASVMDKIRFEAAKQVLQSAFYKNNDKLRAEGKPATFGFLTIRRGKGVAAANEAIHEKNEATVRDFMAKMLDDSHKLATYRPEYESKIAELVAARKAAKTQSDAPILTATVDGLE